MLLITTRKAIRRMIRSVQWTANYPVLLPHVSLQPGAAMLADGSIRFLPPQLIAALGLCDGSRCMRQVAAQSGCRSADLLSLHEEGMLILWHSPPPPPEPGGEPRAILVSPHPDDAALSLGGHLIQNAARGQILIVNVFSRTAWWRFNGVRGLEFVASVREAEERTMARLTGAGLQMLMLPEALLRGHAIDQVFTASPDERDAAVMEAIRSETVLLAARHPRATWLLPLGVGNHIDHRIVRDAALQALGPAASVEFYEELPYAPRVHGQGDFSGFLPERTLVQRKIEIERVIRWKLELNRIYWSQFTWPQIATLEGYARRIGGGIAIERMWAVAAAPRASMCS